MGSLTEKRERIFMDTRLVGYLNMLKHASATCKCMTVYSETCLGTTCTHTRHSDCD